MGSKGGGLLGGRGQGLRGQGKGPIVSGSCGHLSGQEENAESAAVQSSRALPLGRCASPPWMHPSVNLLPPHVPAPHTI